MIRLAVILVAATTAVRADTTFGNSAHAAWSGNSGWTVFRHDRPSAPDGVVFGEAFLSGYAWSANLGWIFFGDGSPDNGHGYSNAGSDHGVNHDGAGNLSGFAWSGNAGWIHFGWASPADVNRPRVDLVTGAFAGFAWSANTGWLSLGSGQLVTLTMARPDSDTDGIADAYEFLHFGNLTTADAASDSDGDGASDLMESLADTDPEDASSRLRITGQSHDGLQSIMTLDFTTRVSRLYRIEHAAELTPLPSWVVSPHGTFAPDPGGSTSRTVAHPPGNRHFFRVRAVVPLQP